MFLQPLLILYQVQRRYWSLSQQSLGGRQEYTVDSSPVQDQFSDSNQPNVHGFRRWKETGVPEKKKPSKAQAEHADSIKQYLNLQSNLELRSYLSYPLQCRAVCFYS